jgi:hypothetical protein
VQKLLLFIITYLMCMVTIAKVPASFNDMEIASAETAIWQSYYSHDAHSVLKNMIVLLSDQYGISNPVVAQDVAEKFTHAYVKFGKTPPASLPQKYNTDVLPLVIKAYEALKQATNATWNPEKAAAADLSWWVARRQNNTLDPEVVASKMLDLFHVLYGSKGNNHLARAAYLRSVAGRYRDQCQDRWGGVNPEDWTVVHLLLEKAYFELRHGSFPVTLKICPGLMKSRNRGV